jgi:hypothetical protein
VSDILSAVWLRLACLLLCSLAPVSVSGQSTEATSVVESTARASSPIAIHVARTRRFLGGRFLEGNLPAARAMTAARRQQAAMQRDQAVSPHLSSLSAAWQPVGPDQITSIAYGKVTGRVTAIATDPADTSGNTVYVGTTGGGVWKSINAAGPVASVTFTPLTDALPVFSQNADSAVIPSLSIGALSVQSGVILAGTGDPNDASDSYYGSGILRSTDGGNSWTLIENTALGITGTYDFSGLGFAGFAWSTSTRGTVVAAVTQAAEGTLVNAPNQTFSVMGLYYSTDAGVTWQMSVIMDGGQVVQTPQPTGGNHGGVAATAVVWNPVRQRFYAAIRYHGYYESSDGITWTRLANQPGTGLTATACPTAPNTVGSASCPIFRGALAVQQVSGDTFALTVDSNNLDQGLWQDVCALTGSNCGSATVTFGTQLPSAALEVGNGSTAIAQADYNLALVAAPAGPSGPTQDTLLYAGTIDLFRCSLAAGCVMRNTTNATNGCAAPSQVAPAQHAIAVQATISQPLLYLGNDGGVWRSTDGVDQQAIPCSPDDASHFQNLNGGIGSLAEVVSFAQPPTEVGTLLVGLGANGSAGTSTASTATAWPQLATGEGGTVAIDQSNPLLWYVSTGAGVSIRQCRNGAACTAADFSGEPTIGPAQVNGDDSLIDTPWMLDPALSSDVLIGTCRGWRGSASDGSLWSSLNAISAPFAGPVNVACGSTNPVVRSFAAGGPVSTSSEAQNVGSQVIYAGIAGALDGGGNFGGHLFGTTNAGTASSTTVWNDLATSPVTNGNGVPFNPGGFDISSIAADPHDATGQTVYASVMGFFTGSGNLSGHLYRSTNAGASWSNISSNLPNAPANSVLVDPNDANTVYVALDTGVYVTTQVTTCSPSINCWSIYGSSLPNAPVVELVASGAMPTGDGRLGELRAATYGRGIWQIPLLTAAAGAQPAMTLNPAALNYSTQAVATESAQQTVVVTNSGLASLTISRVATTGDYSETDTCVGASIAANQSCAVEVRFAPTVTGARNGVLTVYGNVPGGQAMVSLSGVGTPAAAIVLDPIHVSFPTTAINATSAVQNITISNTGNSTIRLQSESIAGSDFKITVNTCGPSLAPSVGCTVGIAFIPSASGARSGTFSVTDDSGTQTAALSGIGVSPATDALAPLSLTFAAQPLTTVSAAQQVVLTNTGDLPLTLIAGAIMSGDFTVVNGCGNSLNPHSTCSMSVAFQPKSLGVISGVLTVSDQYRSQTVVLNGIGIAPPGVSLAPTGSVGFPATGVGVTSVSQTITLTNNVGSTLAVQSVAIIGDFAIVSGGSNCGSSLAPYAECTMQVAFTPSVGGPRTGTMTVTDSAPNSPQMLALSGEGVAFTLTPDGSTSVTITSGQNAVFPLLVSSAANVTGTVQLSCAGFPANSSCTLTPSSVALGGVTTVSLTVLTGVSTSTSSSGLGSGGMLRHRNAGLGGVVWLGMLVPVVVVVRRRGRGRWMMGVGVLCLLVAVGGCGAGRVIPGSGLQGSSPGGGASTASGTYTVVASASYAGVTQSLNLTLVVQ